MREHDRQSSQECLLLLQRILWDRYYFTIKYWFTAQNWAKVFFTSLTFFLGHTKFRAQRPPGFPQSDLNSLTFLLSLCSKNAGSGLLLACLIRHNTLHLFQAIKLQKITFSKIPLYSPQIKTMGNVLFPSLLSYFWTRTQHILFFKSTLASAPTTFPCYASESTAGFTQ